MTAAMLLFLITKRLLILAIVSLFNMVGIELNSGQVTCGMHRELNQINFRLINARSAVNKAAIIHDIISDDCIDILAITEMWVQQDAPDAVKLDIAPPGCNVVHAHRKSDIAKRGSGLAVVYRDNIRVRGPGNTGISFGEFELLVLTVCCSQRSVDIVIIYRPLGPVLSSFIAEFSNLLDYIQLSGSQSIICGDYNCPGSDGEVLDDRLDDVLFTYNLK